MRALGMDVIGSDATAVVVEGDAEGCTISVPTAHRIPLPTLGNNEAVNLLAFQKQIQALVHESQVDAVGIVKATNSKFGLSPERVKLECMIELACYAEKTSYILVAPQTISVAEKGKLEKTAGSKTKAEFNSLTPKYLQRAAYCGWVCLHERGDQGST